MPWIPRGLKDGIVTTGYPRRPDGYGEGFRGTVVVRPGRQDEGQTAAVAEVCPTDAITVDAGQPHLDRGRCILCGRCAGMYPEVFQLAPDFETSAIGREQLVVPHVQESDEAVGRARRELSSRVKALRRSVHIRHVDAGSDGSDEWEIAALTNPVYDVHRLGIFFTASPRHADLLLVTGAGTAGMLGPVQETFDAMPEPKIVVAAGVEAISGGLLGTGHTASGGVTGWLPVDVLVPGSPPTPFGLLHGILLAVGRLVQPGPVAGRIQPPLPVLGGRRSTYRPAMPPEAGS